MVVVAAKHSQKHGSKSRPSSDYEITELVDATRAYTTQNYIQNPKADFLPLEPSPTSAGISVQDIMASELQAARLLNVGMTDEPRQFIHLLETRIKEITGTRKNVILILDEESGTYTCLNDELNAGFATAPRELTWISDTYLQDLLESQQVIHSFLHHQGNIFGIIAIADKVDGSPFMLRDEIVLEQLTQYLSVQVNHFLALKRSMMLPTFQRILLNISNRLLCAVDSADIFQNALESLMEELPFQAGQYIQVHAESGKGHVLYEQFNNTFYKDEPIREVDQFVSLLSLFQSQVWKHSYLYLKGEMLGDKSFSELFGLPDVVSVLVLPVTAEDGDLNGALVLFQQKEAVSLSKEALKVVEQISELVVSACSRAKVLEKALEIATTDELTGCVNRRGFYSRFDAEVDRARRNQTPLCMAMIDVDHFKIANDTYGHQTGDAILHQLAIAIQNNIRKSDVLCRYGGEEFALMLPETHLSAAVELVDRLRRKVERMAIPTPSGPVKITFSAGVDLVETQQNFSKETMDVISESISRSDAALYEAKQLGRNRVIAVDEEK